jgi:hypothetical protein
VINLLIIDNEEYIVTKEDINIWKYTINGILGYNISVELEFKNDLDQKGYLNLLAGYEKENNIMNFVNKKYVGIPFTDNNQILDFEIFDTKKFLDTEIESEIELNVDNIKDGKIKTNFKLNDKLIKIKYEGYLILNSNS